MHIHTVSSPQGVTDITLNIRQESEKVGFFLENPEFLLIFAAETTKNQKLYGNKEGIHDIGISGFFVGFFRYLYWSFLFFPLFDIAAI